MFDAKRLLDQFLGSQSFGSNADPRNQQPGSSSWGDLARGAGDALNRGTGGNLGGVLGGFGGGALAGGLASVLLGSKQGRKLAGNAVMLGGVAVVGTLAYQAYKNWQAGQAPQPQQSSVPMLPPPRETPFNPSSEADQQSLSRNLLRAMISAAKADGHVDATEQANIFAQMDKMTLDAADKAFVIDELRKPLDIDAVAGAARTPEEAAEIYVASLLAVDVDNASERGYLDMLAARLKLDPKLVAHLHATVEGATEKVSAATSG
ncbi:tellurite resistance TerB family protein [Bradyrhizobium sp. LHD-71]|uniref:tellurite resistance TerB family protein n=1 Tax=Bradyrhizobium sp. LHD-71 TaxID=3072141 RepID=UPI00280C8551|nr:tellurite resistance TerB family protein [Bradyrhizobium sp. LHD-71]MDQ8729534.1 tellurite resistance TerB family protein [Bradyrhizobium sp. LHD-71]